MRKALSRSFFLAVFLGVLASSAVYAQDDQPAWSKNLDCPDALKVYRGVEYCTGEVASADGSHTAHVSVVDTSSPGIKLERWLNELCGAQALPAAALAGLWLWRRRRQIG